MNKELEDLKDLYNKIKKDFWVPFESIPELQLRHWTHFYVAAAIVKDMEAYNMLKKEPEPQCSIPPNYFTHEMKEAFDDFFNKLENEVNVAIFDSSWVPHEPEPQFKKVTEVTGCLGYIGWQTENSWIDTDNDRLSITHLVPIKEADTKDYKKYRFRITVEACEVEE